MGALGIVGIVRGSLAHLVGVVLGALVALLICCVLLVTLIVSLLRRALGSRQRPNRRL
jgi:flagellar biosynthesis protein FliP